MSYTVYEIAPEMKIDNPAESEENTGYLRKFWIEHPQLGKSLIKLEEETAPAWSEKVSHEIAKKLNLVSARYEIGLLVGWEEYSLNTKVSVSPNFKQPNERYFPGTELLAQTSPESIYSVEEVLNALEQNDVRLPYSYQPPNGIENGADLFVGYLLLDSFVSNNDRHSGNWEISLDGLGQISLAPVFDNGASFATTFGSLVYEEYSVEKYMNTDSSYFRESQLDTFQQAASLRPKAASIWLRQLENNIKPKVIRSIFEQIPQGRINQNERKFAQELLKYNQNQLLNIQIQFKLDDKLQLAREDGDKIIEKLDITEQKTEKVEDDLAQLNFAVKNLSNQIQKITRPEIGEEKEIAPDSTRENLKTNNKKLDQDEELEL